MKEDIYDVVVGKFKQFTYFRQLTDKQLLEAYELVSKNMKTYDKKQSTEIQYIINEMNRRMKVVY